MNRKRFFAMFLLLLITVLILDAYATKQQNEKIGYALFLILETTADWTIVNFSNINFHYLAETVYTNNPVSVGLLSLQKQPYDSTFTKAQFNIFLPDQLPPGIKFTIRKGSIGITKIYFLTQRKETMAVYVNNTNFIGDIENKQSFIFQSNLFEKYYNSQKQILPTIIRDASHSSIKKLVLAFYFPWYYPENWRWTGKLSIAHQPLLGLYNSSDEKVIQTHIEWAKKAAIDGFICSWWGINSITDQNLKKLVKKCDENEFKFSIYLEEAKNTKDLKKSLAYLDSLFYMHPAILRFKDKPVIFIFKRILDSIPLDSLRKLTSRFSVINYGYQISNLTGSEGFHEFLPPSNNVTELKNFYSLAKEIAHRKGKIFTASVMPGYNNRKLNPPHNFIDRRNGKYYKDMWHAALVSNPDWILITSFNEWFEGTEIEPSLEHKDLYLKLTKQYSQTFKQNEQLMFNENENRN